MASISMDPSLRPSVLVGQRSRSTRLSLLPSPPTSTFSLPMATTSSPPLPPLPLSFSTCTSSALPQVRHSRLRFNSAPASAPVSLLPLGHGCRSWPTFRCPSAARPLPPSSEPPPPSPQDWQEKLSRLQDTVRIFFAVLFWMSLFFWGSAWGGSNNSGGKKRQRFRNKSK